MRKGGLCSREGNRFIWNSRLKDNLLFQQGLNLKEDQRTRLLLAFPLGAKVGILHASLSFWGLGGHMIVGLGDHSGQQGCWSFQTASFYSMKPLLFLCLFVPCLAPTKNGQDGKWFFDFFLGEWFSYILPFLIFTFSFFLFLSVENVCIFFFFCC